MATRRYDFATIEPKWQGFWAEENLSQASETASDDRKRHYCLVMYPYPSGDLHMGHVINYTIGDALVRYHLMVGENLLSPMGWDSFGLPAENAAIRNGTPPADYTVLNIDKMRAQMKRAGWLYDWDRELATSHPGYYRWTQWLFLQFYKAGLAVKKHAPVNWCPSCATVLANEQVQDGHCERCDTEVDQRNLNQWFFRMSKYAGRLLDNLKQLEGRWPERVITMQRNWIGRSEGARLDFTIDAPSSDVHGDVLSVFTTRPDTTFGVTFMALAPEHPLVEQLVTGTELESDVMVAVKRMRNQSAIERTSEESEKEGMFLGAHVINPFDGSKAELWVTNYALMEYGTGAVMAVPAHDQRDFLFARKYDLPIKVVIQPADEVLNSATMPAAFVDDGIMVSSGQFDGSGNRDAIVAMTQWCKDNGTGDFEINFRLRDWLLSRQRYWGAPIPIVYCDACGEQPVNEDDLPVLLPKDVEFKPTGDSPLATSESFANAPCPKCGEPAKRELDTMDTFVDSSWYFFRYVSPRNEDDALDPDGIKRWMPVDQYVGGIEHANMHLVYARFFTMVLHDLGLVDFDEPFSRLFCQGMLSNVTYYCDEHKWLTADEVDGIDNGQPLCCRSCGGPVRSEISKMSKTKRNGISPDELFDRYGADTVRTAVLFFGPPERNMEYSEAAVSGIVRFLGRIWNVVLDLAPQTREVARYEGDGQGLDDASKNLRRRAHQTLQAWNQAFQPGQFAFNTAIARIMELINDLRSSQCQDGTVLREAVEIALWCLAPFAPHIAEELWAELGHRQSIFRSGGITPDEKAAQADTIEIVFMVNGKVRGKQSVPVDTDKAALETLALEHENLVKYLDGKTPKKVIVVPKKLVNVVV